MLDDAYRWLKGEGYLAYTEPPALQHSRRPALAER